MQPFIKGLRAFSLIEVTLAIGIVSFCILPILALLPVGLNATREAIVQSGVASIGRQLQTEMLGISFDAANTNSVQNLKNQTFYFTEKGVRTDLSSEAFFKTSFALQDIGLGTTSTYASSGQTVAVTVVYPMSAPEAARRKNRFSLFVARQTNR
jgi:uncharacterized protein (TIGR02598 family)